MTFLNGLPLVLLLTLPLIPLLLHLLTRQRLRTVELPTFRFLLDSFVQQRRRTRFLEALLTLLRMLFIAGIILFVARPMCNRTSSLFPAGSGRDVIILVDCSASMNATALGDTAHDRARKYAKEVVSHLSKDDPVTLIRVSGRPEVVAQRFTNEADKIAAQIDKLPLSPARANLFAALQSVFGDDKNRPANPLVYYFTDCQASGWREIEEQKQSVGRFLPQGTPFILVDVSSEQQRPNIAVTGMPPPKRRAVVGLPIDLQARVHNFAARDVEATVSLSIGGDIVESKTIQLPARREMIVPFDSYVPSKSGVAQGVFSIKPKDPSHDSFADDNDWQFALHVRQRLQVLIINGNPNEDPNQDETLFLRAALARSKDEEQADLRKSLDVVVEPESAFANLDEAAFRGKLDRYHVVVLANCGLLHQVNPQAFARLRDYVSDGGGLLIFPGDKVNPDVYNTAFFAPVPPLTTARLGQALGDPDRADTFVRIANDSGDSFSHSAVAMFRQPANAKARYFASVVIKRRFPITIADPNHADVILRFRDRERTPALIDSTFGDGLVIVSSFPINGRWTNLPYNRAEFVPLMIELIRHAQKRPEIEGPTVVPADANAEFGASNQWLPIRASVTDPSGLPHDLLFERAGTRAEAVFDQTGQRGIYSVKIASGHKTDESQSLVFAVNLAAEESDPAKIDEAAASALLPTAQLTYENRTAESTQREPPDTRNEFWREIIYALFGVIACELLLSTMGGGRGEGASATAAA